MKIFEKLDEMFQKVENIESKFNDFVINFGLIIFSIAINVLLVIGIISGIYASIYYNTRLWYDVANYLYKLYIYVFFILYYDTIPLAICYFLGYILVARTIIKRGQE